MDAPDALLACPECHKLLQHFTQDIVCGACETKVFVRDGVVSVTDPRNSASFDDKFEVMQKSNDDDGVQWLSYKRQAALVEEALRPGQVVLDVGCGPSISYKNKSGAFLIGLDPSFPSVKVNKAVDLRLCANADRLPLKNQSVDLVVCLYSVHHMVGAHVGENRHKVARALKEFHRVIKPNGSLLVFEVNPWYPVWVAEKLCWNTARQLFKTKLDMHFWPAKALQELGTQHLPNSKFELIQFKTGPFVTFPPVFTMPWLKIPRLLYPFDANCLHWQME